MKTVVIIGAGFSGTLTAVHLLRRIADAGNTSQLRRIVLVDRSGRFGRGVAYGTTCSLHLLNVPTGRMSAFPDQPDNFLNWAKAKHPNVPAYSFLPRMTYGQYLEDLLADARQRCPKVELSQLSDDVIRVIPDPSGEPARVEFASATPLTADRVILALGNYPPADPRADGDAIYKTDCYISDSWDARRFGRITPNETVMIIGTGLTALDIVLQLNAAGHTGTIHAVSRHGLTPRRHLDSPVTARTWELDEWPIEPRNLLRALRQRVKEAAASGGDWRSIVDGLRPRTIGIWQRFSDAQRRQFFRHLRHFWEVHRHRVAPDVANTFEDLQKCGRLLLHTARIRSYRAITDGIVDVTLSPRQGHGTSHAAGDCVIRVNRVINCTGPDSDFTRIADPLVRQLLSDGFIHPDPLRIGLETDECGAVIDRDGRPSDVLFTLGPARKPALWESTAVPELRDQTAALAAHLIGS